MYTITLRRAAKVQADIRAWIQKKNESMEWEVEIPFGVDSKGLHDRFRSGATKVVDTQTSIINMEDILGRIRLAVGEKNHQAGINQLLTEESSINSKIRKLSSWVGKSVVPTDFQDVIASYTHRAEKSKASDYYQTDFKVSTLTENRKSFMDEMILALKKNLNRVQDEVSSLNTTNTISISDADYKFLDQQGLV